MRASIILSEKNILEKQAWSANRLTCGVDEVGRGCLAGPLVVCAAVLPANTTHPFLKDSKKLSEKKREIMYEWLTERCTYTVACADAHMIDRINIYQATLRTMQRACLQLLTTQPATWQQLEYIIVDAMPLHLPLATTPTIHYFPHGEEQSASIAAASIIAKVTRDRLLKRIDHLFPAFTFAQHKGYGTADHRMTLHSHRATMLHRKSFLGKILT